MLRPTVVYSFLRVLFCLVVLSFLVLLFQVSCRLFLCQVVIQMMMTPFLVLFQECAALLITSFFFSSLFVLLFAFGLISSGASLSCRCCASSLMLPTAIVWLSSIVIASNDAFAFAFAFASSFLLLVGWLLLLLSRVTEKNLKQLLR